MILRLTILLATAGWAAASLHAQDAPRETLRALRNEQAPADFEEMWAGFDPRREPLEVETLEQWEEEGVVLRVVRFRIGVFKGKQAKLAAVYGFPTGERSLPALLQIHGGGQYADAKACIANAKRGYATISIAWAGRISSSQYRVNADVVKLFWEAKKDDPGYRETTDWGALDGYHAPSRNQGNQFPSARAADWTLDPVESPRNSGWFLCAIAARRALTFLEHQPEVDKNRIGVYGHSMGGKLTVLTAPDDRVKAAAPSCGGISDRYNASKLFRQTLGDGVSLKQITCPIIFLSPANDFHGRIGDLPKAVEEIESDQWRVTCSPHHNHQDTPPFEVATLLWFDQHLKGTFKMPATPTTNLRLDSANGVPVLSVVADDSKPVVSIDVYYSQQGKPNETPQDRELTMNRFWHHVKPQAVDGRWVAELPVIDTGKPLWAYANVTYALDEPVSGAGYYYGSYTAKTFNLSSLLATASPDQLQTAGVKETLEPTLVIETFQADWEKEWFTYKPDLWARSTHKIHDQRFQAPQGAQLVLRVQSDQANELIVRLDDFVAKVPLPGGEEVREVVLNASDFTDFAGEALTSFRTTRRLTLSATERLRPGPGQRGRPRIIGKNWNGAAPRFHLLRWQQAFEQ